MNQIKTVSQILKLATSTWTILINEQDDSEGSVMKPKPQWIISCLYRNGFLQHLSGLQNHNEPVIAVYLLFYSHPVPVLYMLCV